MSMTCARLSVLVLAATLAAAGPALAQSAAELQEAAARLRADARALAASADAPWTPQERERAAAERQKAREAAARDREQGRAERAYAEAQRLLDRSQYDRAAERFGEVAAMKAARADGALYWKAFAQDRQGQRADALATLATLMRDYPNSRYLQQAKVLEAEVRRNAGQPARPQDQSDEEMKILALNALQNTAPEQAIPMLQKVLQGTASPRLKERALFVLAQSRSPQAREVLVGIARGNSTPELQVRAIQYLGTHGGRDSLAVLGDLYGSTTDVDVKKRILRAFMIGGDKERLVTAAQSEQNPELRATAVQQLGVMGAHAELSQLYQRESSVEVKKQIIRAMFVGGNAARMTELARTEKNPELRREAIRNLGLMEGKASNDTLAEIYASDRDVEVRTAVIQALFIQGNATALVAMARKETDPALKREIVQKLSLMNSKEATDYMLELLNSK